MRLKHKIDFDRVGNMVLMTPRSKRALRWLRQNVVSEPWQWLGSALACDQRAAWDIFVALGGTP